MRRWQPAAASLTCSAVPHRLRDKYRVLERFEVQVPDDQLELLDQLDDAWARFQVRVVLAPLTGGVCMPPPPKKNTHHRATTA
jgi:hypothetical protein